MTLAEAIDLTIQSKREQRRDAALRKLEFARKCVDAYCGADSVSLSDIDESWVESFSQWLISTRGLSPNSRATYLRAIYSALRFVARQGENVDLAAIPIGLRTNSPALSAPSPATVTVRKTDDKPHWFAMKCRATDSEEMAHRIADEFPDVEVFRTDVERIVDTPSGKHRRMIELLKDIMFFRTTLQICQRMKSAYHSVAYIFDYPSEGSRKMAVVSDMDMKMFMYFNDIAPERILLYFPDEAMRTTISAGTPVTITDGRFRGATGTVISGDTSTPLEATVAVSFPLLGIAASAPIPWRFLQAKN